MKKAIIIGAGPAGLTAAYEMLKRTDIIPVIVEKSEYIGGISRTIDYKGNRMDMGPHRFFSKSDRVMDWWLKIMPLEEAGQDEITIKYQNKTRTIQSDEYQSAQFSNGSDKKMLVIQRLTRIYFLRKFFAYPIKLTIDTLKTLGLNRTIRILLSFMYVRLFPRKPEKSLEDFIINKFGKELYLLFFKDYTEKVWGVPCHEISAEWGAQRIKGVSLSKAVLEAVRSMGASGKNKTGIQQKEKETSLIEQFLYPKYGPGSLWEEVARQIQEMGGKIFLHQDVQHIYSTDHEVCSVHTINSETGELFLYEGDYFFSTMPVQELIAGMGNKVPNIVKDAAAGLQYRDFINVGILLKQMSTQQPSGEYERLELKDNWIYIQERDVKVGRLMIYNNWGTGMIKDPNTVWIGMEYFCNKSDDFWALDNESIQSKAIMELEKMGLARVEDVLDITVRRMEKTYPAYFGTYHDFGKIREYTDQFENLFLVGRNGMHKYNNADHSMLTAMVAVDNIEAGVLSKENIWSINTEQEYHEEKSIVEKTKEGIMQPGVSKLMPNLSGNTLKESFKDYVWKNRWNRGYVITAFVAFIIQFILFKVRYPFANYMPDSYSYLEAAYSNADINMWPVAYSKFLRFISVFTHSDKIVVSLQYLFMQASTIFFLFTLFFFIRPGKIIRNVLFCFFLFSPIPLYVANYISADSLFVGFSLLWISSLLWILYSPRSWQILLHAFLLLCCFTLRYNAIYYPIVSALVLLLSRQRWVWRIGGIALGAVFIFASITYTSHRMKDLTGKQQFSAFGGWQMANNALYMYQHIPVNERGPVPTKFSKLETMVREHMDTLQKIKFSREDSANSYFYLWSGRGPLIQYLAREWKKDSTTPYFKRWASEGPLYLDYAKYLITKYPLAFAEYFMIPNAVKFAVPPSEFLGTYNMGGDSVGRLAKEWFQYRSLKVRNHTKNQASIMLVEWYPVFSALVNVLLIIHVVGLLVLGGLRNSGDLWKVLFLAVTIWVLNAGFSVFASPIVLRYQIFPIIISFCIAMVAGDRIYRTDSESTKLKHAM